MEGSRRELNADDVVQVFERKPGLRKSDVEMIVGEYDAAKGFWRKKAGNHRGGSTEAIIALKALLTNINDDPKTGNISDSTLLNIINCFAENNKVKEGKATFNTLVKLLERAFPERKDLTMMAAQLIRLPVVKQEIIIQGAGKNPTLNSIRKTFLVSVGIARDNQQPIYDYALKFNGSLDATKVPKEKNKELKGKDKELNDYLDTLKINTEEIISVWTREKNDAKLVEYKNERTKLEERLLLDGRRKQVAYDNELMSMAKEFTAKGDDRGVNFDLIGAVNKLIASLKAKGELPDGINTINPRKDLFEQIKPIFERIKSILEENVPASKEELGDMQNTAVALNALVPMLNLQKGFVGINLKAEQAEYLEKFQVNVQAKIQVSKTQSQPHAEGTLSSKMMAERTGEAQNSPPEVAIFESLGKKK